MPAIDKKIPKMIHHAERVSLVGAAQSKDYPTDVCDSFQLLITWDSASQRDNSTVRLFHGEMADGSDMVEFLSTQDCYTESLTGSATTWKSLLEFDPCKAYFRVDIEGNQGGNADIDVFKQNCMQLGYPRETDTGIQHCTINCPCEQICP